ncbi:flavanone 3-hydroxylase [Hibiscus syriacus]|uniref:Flavanone 3-hydroxylase n=1 Tax=Hibiscus syriacus TaxID=106335 RepID=A0A6A3BI75_HIBSY|nr:flavanone 3-hydroxylase [Hibiscus syriacus]
MIPLRKNFNGKEVCLPPPPPPPPPPPSSWDFWDPFAQANASRSVTDEEWEAATSASEAAVAAASVAAPPSVVSGTFSKDTGSELAMVVSRNTKELVEMVKEVDGYFLKAAGAGSHLSLLLEVSNSNFSAQSKGAGKVYNYSCNLTPTSWTWNCNQRTEGIEKLGEDQNNAEAIKIEHEKRVAHLRKLEVKRADYMKTWKAKKEVEKLESQMMVASQAIETLLLKSSDSENQSFILSFSSLLMCMWRSMYEIHQVHTHIVQQLKCLNFIPSTEPSEIHRQSTLLLEMQVQQWHLSFCYIVKAQRDYIQSLAGWLRLSLFQIPDKVASDGIKSFLTVINAIVVQQAEKHKQKKKTDSAFKDFEKKAAELRSLESKFSPYSVLESNKDPVAEKRTKVDLLRAKAEEEKNKHEKSVSPGR